MKITIKHDRDDKGWIAVREGAFHGVNNNAIYKTMADACIAAHMAHPEAECIVDDRKHTKMDNGLVFCPDEADPLPVTFKQRRK